MSEAAPEATSALFTIALISTECDGIGIGMIEGTAVPVTTSCRTVKFAKSIAFSGVHAVS